MTVRKVNLTAMFGRFHDQWSPKVVGEVNDSLVKLVKLKGEFVWHHHDNEDELFLVVKGGCASRCATRMSYSGLASSPSSPRRRAPAGRRGRDARAAVRAQYDTQHREHQQ